MTSLTHQHDQALAYIKMDSKGIVIDGNLSYETIAKEFEIYWRSVIGDEVARKHKFSTGLLQSAHPVMITIWGLDDD